MTLDKDEFAQALSTIEDTYELGSGFLLRLTKEDDWSFVIKAHALVEAAVSQLLTHHVGDTRLSRVFERLELSNQQTGRLAFARALDLLDEDDRRFVRSFSELRNRLVHNVHNVRFRFRDDLAGMDSNQLAAFVEWISYFADPGPGQATWRPLALEHPKHTLWMATVMFVGACLNKTEKAKYDHERIARALDILEASGIEEEDDLDA